MFKFDRPSRNPIKCSKTAKISHFRPQNAIEMHGILDGGIKGNMGSDKMGYKIGHFVL